MRIGVDILSGEASNFELMKGCYDALIERKDFELVLIGNIKEFETIINSKHDKFFLKNQELKKRISFIEASEVITMDDDPLKIVKVKKDSSIIKGLNAHKNKEIDAFVSPGNTGALVLSSALILGRIKGIKKPALAAPMPNISGSANILLDVGASAECDVSDYIKFAIMGHIYAEEILGKINPKIGLLNIGEEAHKGTSTVKEVYRILSDMHLNFIGNVEGRDIFSNVADVIVCDGYIGNIALKTAEGASYTITKILKNSIKSNLLATISLPLYYSALKELKKRMDPEKYGGVPLLGINGCVYKAHGNTGRVGIKYAILTAVNGVQHDILGKINNRIKQVVI